MNNELVRVSVQPINSHADTAISPNPVPAIARKHHSTKSIEGPLSAGMDNRALERGFLITKDNTKGDRAGVGASVLHFSSAANLQHVTMRTRPETGGCSGLADLNDLGDRLG